jgi:hypothetical protein
MRDMTLNFEELPLCWIPAKRLAQPEGRFGLIDGKYRVTWEEDTKGFHIEEIWVEVAYLATKDRKGVAELVQLNEKSDIERALFRLVEHAIRKEEGERILNYMATSEFGAMVDDIAEGRA